MLPDSVRSRSQLQAVGDFARFGIGFKTGRETFQGHDSREIIAFYLLTPAWVQPDSSLNSRRSFQGTCWPRQCKLPEQSINPLRKAPANAKVCYIEHLSLTFSGILRA